MLMNRMSTVNPWIICGNSRDCSLKKTSSSDMLFLRRGWLRILELATFMQKHIYRLWDALFEFILFVPYTETELQMEVSNNKSCSIRMHWTNGRAPSLFSKIFVTKIFLTFRFEKAVEIRSLRQRKLFSKFNEYQQVGKNYFNIPICKDFHEKNCENKTEIQQSDFSIVFTTFDQ